MAIVNGAWNRLKGVPGGRPLPGFWSDAFGAKDMVAIADWFGAKYFRIGIITIMLAGVVAGLSGVDGLARQPWREAVARPATVTPPRPAGPARTNRQLAANIPASENHSTRDPAFNLALAMRVLSLGLLFAGANGVLGWVIGLIFGVPRVLNPPTTAGGAAVPTSTVNNNLGDISDWLTKTLVGVGLTQLYSLPKFLGDIAADANSYGFQWGDYGQLLAFSILLYFFNGGFWLGYFGTRTFITILFGQFASGLPKSSIALAGQPLKLALDSANNFAPAPPELRVVDAALLSVPLQSLSSRDEVMAWAAAQARAQNPNAARAALENVLACDPGNQDAMRQLVKVYLALGQYGDAVRLGKALTEDTAPKMVAALYDFAPGGFREAQRIGLKLMQDKDAEEGPTIHVWLACAYAQEFGWLKKQQPNDAAKIATAHDNAMAQIQRTLELDPTVRDQLHAFWKPADPNTMDNDLAVFGDDPELKKLLEPDIDPPAPAPSQDVQPVAPPPTPQAPKPDPAPEPGEPK